MPGSQREEKYSSTTGVIFLFNLIVGTGALALPGAIQKAGYFLGVFLLLVLALFSFITVSFIVESLAAANALSRKRSEGVEILEDENSVEETPLVFQPDTQDFNIFEITEKYEICQMGVLMSPMWCQILIYSCLCIYLFGDLAIYAVVIGKTGTQIICTNKDNSSTIFKVSENILCWKNHSITRMDAYRLIVAIFVILLGPFTFFNLQKTKFLQILTSIMRWLAFFIMLVWSINRLITVKKEGNPPFAEFSELPTLFGTLVYSFMCQHSIPGLLQPIKNKKHLRAIIGVDYGLVCGFYLILALTAIFAFKKLEDIYTLNFWEESFKANTTKFQKFFAYYLTFFPVFTLSTNFPIIGITLKNNLRSILLKDASPYWYYDRLLFPLITILPPAILALAVSDVHFLFGMIGSYAGTCVQYLIPCLLVTFSRSQTVELGTVNIYASPFKSIFWIYAVYVWMGLSLALITINYITH